MNKRDIDAIVSALSPVIAARVDAAIAAKGAPVSGAVDGPAFSDRHAEYQPGMVTLASNSFREGSPDFRAAIPQIDVAAHPCATDLDADAEPIAIVTFINAMNAKVNALIEACGHGTSAALADHV